MARRDVGVDGELDVSEQRYEVMYFVDLADEHIQAFKQAWGEIGDSIVVVGGDGLWNCHVHTNDIGAAIEAALDLDGRPSQIRVTDLFEEVAEEHAVREAELVAAMAGDGQRHAADELPARHLRRRRRRQRRRASAELFGQLGVQGIVTGGQTLNPSTAELLAAVEAVNADQVVVLPEQQEHHPGRRAARRPDHEDGPGRAHPVDARGTRRVDGLRPRGRCPTQRPRRCADAARSVATGEVTQAVRDAPATPAGHVADGDWIGHRSRRRHRRRRHADARR